MVLPVVRHKLLKDQAVTGLPTEARGSYHHKRRMLSGGKQGKQR
jgi:hypothetical protein